MMRSEARGAAGEGKLAVVSGGSGGIGREIARAVARRGYRTVLIARREEELRCVVQELGRWAPSTAVAVDLSSRRDLGDLSELLRELGAVDVLVNCAGHGLYKPFLECTPEELHGLMLVHYFAAAALVHAVLPSMLARGGGHVINIGSMSAKMGPWGHSGYAAAKAALASLTETLAAEHQGSGVHFSIVHPGLVDTPFFAHPPLDRLRERFERRLVAPERVARAVTALLDRPRLQVCVPRAYRVTDVLAAVSPALLHHLVARSSRPTPRPARRP
ncbi:SDR family NAD(P)-dependent oxidoreductase [Streptomyces sp. NPDC000229]|uniref:SDR family NAD(P)-dependent oxidoreductase n=1 Tax=Streptomyces sp. NPDC000229 TaxID=3154247 RepID=UPI00332DDCD9